MRALKHLPENQWPAEDRPLFDVAYAEGDIFDGTEGPGAHFSEATRKCVWFAWRRWLGYLATHDPEALELPAADRITPERLRPYVEHLGITMKGTSVATMVSHLYDGSRIIAPERDWSWLKALRARLQARSCPEDRFERLVPGHQTLDLGFRLMDEALLIPESRRRECEIQFRDGLIIVLLSLWPIRRRSIAALTIDHLEIIGSGAANLLLDPKDTKKKRDESWPVPDELLPYLTRYLAEIRPRLLVRKQHNGLWPSMKGGPVRGSQIYSMVRRRTKEAFGKAMSLHDFRRSAATFLAMQAPEKVGLTPGVLQHANPETADRYYNLARSADASRRHSAVFALMRARLREPDTRGR